jgi:O-antigen/teichoic acid export membrane protein
MQALLSHYKQNNFFRYNVIFFVGSIAVAFLNYLYHPALSRLLSLEDFGEVQTIFSLSIQIGVILNVLGIVAVNIIANKERNPERELLLRDIQSLALYAMATVSAVLLFFIPLLQVQFQFKDPLPFYILAILLITTVPATFRRSYLQGRNNFVALSLSSILLAGGRLAIAIALVLFGLGTAGALGALVIAQIITLGYLYYLTRESESLAFVARPVFSRQLVHELKYLLLTLVSIGFVAFLTSADILFVKYYFDPVLAGSYSGISTVAKIIFFATSSIAAVLIPSIKLEHSFTEHASIFGKSLLLLVAVGLGTLTILTFFPEYVISLLIGQKFLITAELLPQLSLVMFMVSIINLMVSYFLALRMYSLVIAGVIGAASTVTAITIMHTSLASIVSGFMIGSCMTLGSLIIIFTWVWYSRGRERSKHSPTKNKKNHHNYADL